MPRLTLTAVATALVAVACAPAAFAGEACPNAAFRTGAAALLPECRTFELVSPAQKHGADVAVDPGRVRVSESEAPGLPMAATFSSLGGFGDVLGSGIAFDYLSERSLVAGTQGWATHPITPFQLPMPYTAIITARDPLYEGDADPDLTRMLFRSWSPLTEEPNVAGIPDLYLRDDLRSPGAGSYELLSGAVAPVTPEIPPSSRDEPQVAGTSADFRHVVFESVYPLTANAPQSTAASKLYESDEGVVRLVGVLPNGSPAPRSIAGQTAGTTLGNAAFTPHVVSSDGSRVFFTVPTSNEVTDGAGALYMRDSHGTASTADDTTVRIDTPEGGAAGGTGKSQYWDAAADGSRVFFTSENALTADATTAGGMQLYMYDASKPDSDPNNLMYISQDQEPADSVDQVLGVLGASNDGHTVYFLQQGQIVHGQPQLGKLPGQAFIPYGIYVWRDGIGVQYVGEMGDQQDAPNDLGGAIHAAQDQVGAVVSRDGRFLLISLRKPPWPGGADHGNCHDGLTGCQELYLYDAQRGDHPVCVSCDPAGVSPSSPAFYYTFAGRGGSQTTAHRTSPLPVDGNVFFMTSEALVPQDLNGKVDVYEWVRADGSVHLISTGQSPEGSYFLNAIPDGHDVLIATHERLSAWDVDQSADVYDARVDGGVPGPVTAGVCGGEACKGPLVGAPGSVAFASVGVSGSGNLSGAPVQKPAAKGLTKAQGLAKALSACRKQARARGRRGKCEARARKRYGAKASRRGVKQGGLR